MLATVVFPNVQIIAHLHWCGAFLTYVDILVPGISQPIGHHGVGHLADQGLVDVASEEIPAVETMA